MAAPILPPFPLPPPPPAPPKDVQIPLAIPFYQSGYIYLQAAGSTDTASLGPDGSSRGFHLRWDFLRLLREKHIAKGNLASSAPYNTNIAFNKPNDFVRIYRAPYHPHRYSAKVGLLNGNPPGLRIETGPTREWKYTVEAVPANLPVSNPDHLPAENTTVVIRFNDVAQYDTIKTTINPQTNSRDFIQAYTGMMEIEAENKLMYAANIDTNYTVATPAAKAASYFKVEAVSIPDSLEITDKTISSRKHYVGPDAHDSNLHSHIDPPPGPLVNNQVRIVEDNIKYVRFIYNNAYPAQLELECYKDYILGMNRDGRTAANLTKGGWERVQDLNGKDFSLTVNNIESYVRLYNPRLSPPNIGNVHGKWPKFNDADPGTGAFTVNGLNYIEKWDPANALEDPNGLFAAVDAYLTKSKTDVYAEADLPSSSQNPTDFSHLKVKYIDMLRTIALDFHVARMLGFGHIDDPNPQNNNELFIYVAEYVTDGNLLDDLPGGGPDGNVTHLYMTPPIARKYFRLPAAPELDPISYGLYVNNATQSPTLITDIFGYSPFDDSRFINLNKKPYQLDVPFQPFFAQTNEFAMINTTRPVMFGVEYRGTLEPNFRKPEISNDPEFFDITGRPETVPILEQPNPFFVHQEKEEGSHTYACYAINWFSRSSPVSNTLSTDFTQFPDRRKLLPPLNLAVQLVQEEDPRILTTLAEQDLLEDITAPDKTLVRITFDWNHTHNIAHQYATYAELFFRPELPRSVKGKILSVSAPDYLNNVIVTTGPISITSSNPAQVVQPNIPPGLENNFNFGIVTVGGRSYVIKAVFPSVNGDNPSFMLGQVRETVSSDPNNNNQFTTTEQFLSPQPGSSFVAVENLNSPFNWSTMLKRRIGLVKFSTEDYVKITNSDSNNGSYKVSSLVFSSGSTYITVKEKIPSDIGTLGDLSYHKSVPIILVDQPNGKFTVQGDIVAELQSTGTFNVLLSDENDGIYTVQTAQLVSGNTEITVASIPSALDFGNVVYERIIPVDLIDLPLNRFVITGDVTGELIPSHKETFIQDDGSPVELNIGGIFRPANVKHFFYPEAPTAPTGIYEIAFTNYQLPDHPDDRDEYKIEWYKGVVRIPSLTGIDKKVLQVFDINTGGPNLRLLVVDPDFNPDIPSASIDPVIPDVGGDSDYTNDVILLNVNFHPSYRTYFRDDSSFNPNTGNPNNFTEPVILPSAGEGVKQTIMAIRSVDTTTIIPLESAISTPVSLIAREIITPLQLQEPSGPVFATRPDFYGKSTYTFDVMVSQMVLPDPRRPFSVVFYRCNERKILDTLYSPATVDQILLDLAALQSPDADFMNDRWKDLANLNYDTQGGIFNEYTPGGYRFPLPDNPDYTIPLPKSPTIPVVEPFTTAPNLNDPIQYFDGVENRSTTIAVIAQEAVLGAFLPLTEQPLIYRYIKPGHKTSARKPVFRDSNGELIPPDDGTFDPFPMAVQYAKMPGNPNSFFFSPADISDPAKEVYVRFTDYTLDGASKSIYFYYGQEISNTSRFGPPSIVVGPVRLVNSFPAESPGIKKTITQLSNPLLGVPTAVAFELNEYIASENIKKFQIFRATSQKEALSTRSMALAKTVDVGDPVTDDFSDIPIPPYGEPLYYRIVALREILNEQAQVELVPSKPSNVVLTNIVDNINPAPPQISYTSDPPAGSPLQIDNVVLSWPTTAFNATYHLYKMNNTGNWVKIHSIVSNAALINVALSATDLQNGTLFKQDADLNTIFHRFRVQVVNSSGLLNLTDNELTI